MKRLFTALVLMAALWQFGCANEGPTGEELQDQVGRGLRGQGEVTPDIDRTGDPYVKPRGGPPAPHE